MFTCELHITFILLLAKALKYQDPDIAYLLTSKFASISDDSIIVSL